jgi:hypothetical protein
VTTFTEQQLLDMAEWMQGDVRAMLTQAAADRRRVEALEKAIKEAAEKEWYLATVPLIMRRAAELEQHKDG